MLAKKEDEIGNIPDGLKWIVMGTLIVGVSSFFLTLAAKIFAELH